jgi:hypothetical protein
MTQAGCRPQFLRMGWISPRRDGAYNVTQFEFTHARRFNRLKPGIDNGQAIPPELIQGNKPLLKGYGWL